MLVYMCVHCGFTCYTSYIDSIHTFLKTSQVIFLKLIALPMALPSEVLVFLYIPCVPYPSQPLFSSLLCSKARGTTSIPSPRGGDLIWGSLTDIIPDGVEALKLTLGGCQDFSVGGMSGRTGPRVRTMWQELRSHRGAISRMLAA